MKTSDQAFIEDFTRDIPHGLSSRSLSEAALPRARWQNPEVIQAAYNPTGVVTLDNPTMTEDAGLIADALLITERGNKEPHWDECAKNFLVGLLLYVATDPV